MTCRLPVLFAVALSLVWTQSSWALTADEKEQVRRLVKEGGDLVEQKDHSGARDRFVAALQVAQLPTVALFAGRECESLGELAKAAKYYRLASEMPIDETLWDKDKRKTETHKQSRDEAKAALRALLARSPSVKIQLLGNITPDTKLTLDEVELGHEDLAYEHPVKPGIHTLVAQQGEHRLTESLKIEEKQKRTVTLDITPFSTTKPAAATQAPPKPAEQTAAPSSEESGTKFAAPKPEASSPPPASPKTAGSGRAYATWAAFGVGAAGLVMGTTAAVITAGKRSDLRDQGCASDGSCPTNANIDPGAVESHNNWRVVSTIGYVVGGVGLAAGVTLWLTKPKAESPQVALLVGPNSIALGGGF